MDHNTGGGGGGASDTRQSFINLFARNRNSQQPPPHNPSSSSAAQQPQPEVPVHESRETRRRRDENLALGIGVNMSSLGMLRRRRSAETTNTLNNALNGNTTTAAPTPSLGNLSLASGTNNSSRRTTLPPPPPPPSAATTPAATSSVGPPLALSSEATAMHTIRLVPHLESTRTLRFDPISRQVRQGDPPLRIGRFTDRHSSRDPGGVGNRLAFRSKVVSRGHAEVWIESGKFHIKDTRSSSGTFLNHQRLSPANTESRAYPLKDGDLLQLGVDFQGGTQDIYKCVKIRVEIGREWQKAANAFNAQAMKNLRALTHSVSVSDLKSAGGGAAMLTKNGKPAGGKKSSGMDCCICLFALSICQSIFIAPCSHSFHYKCIRPLLVQQFPGFTCPLCRTWADLEEDVEVEEEYGEESGSEALIEVDEQVQVLKVDDTSDHDGGKGKATSPPAPNSAGLPQPPTSGSSNSHHNVVAPPRLLPEVNGADSDAEMHSRGDVSDAEFVMPPTSDARGSLGPERSMMSVDIDDDNNEEAEAERQAVLDGGADVEVELDQDHLVGEETRLGDTSQIVVGEDEEEEEEEEEREDSPVVVESQLTAIGTGPDPASLPLPSPTHRSHPLRSSSNPFIIRSRGVSPPNPHHQAHHSEGEPTTGGERSGTSRPTFFDNLLRRRAGSLSAQASTTSSPNRSEGEESSGAIGEKRKHRQ